MYTSVSRVDDFVLDSWRGFWISGLHPGSTMASWWSSPVLQRGSCYDLFLASVLFGIHAVWLNRGEMLCLDNGSKCVVAQLSISPHHSAHGDTIWFLVVSANTVDREHQSGVHLSWWLSTTQNLTSVVETTCLCHQFVVSFLGPSIVCQTALSARMSAGVYNILPCVPHCQQYRRSVCVTTVRELQLGWNNESLLTFDLAFCWAKVRSKYWLKLKSKVVSLSQSLRPNLRFGDWLAERLRPKFRSKYLLRPKLSRTNLT